MRHVSPAGKVLADNLVITEVTLGLAICSFSQAVLLQYRDFPEIGSWSKYLF